MAREMQGGRCREGVLPQGPGEGGSTEGALKGTHGSCHLCGCIVCCRSLPFLRVCPPLLRCTLFPLLRCAVLLLCTCLALVRCAFLPVLGYIPLFGWPLPLRCIPLLRCIILGCSLALPRRCSQPRATQGGTGN